MIVDPLAIGRQSKQILPISERAYITSSQYHRFAVAKSCPAGEISASSQPNRIGEH